MSVTRGGLGAIVPFVKKTTMEWIVRLVLTVEMETVMIHWPEMDLVSAKLVGTLQAIAAPVYLITMVQSVFPAHFVFMGHVMTLKMGMELVFARLAGIQCLIARIVFLISMVRVVLPVLSVEMGPVMIQFLELEIVFASMAGRV